ncbi:hypothetical protein GF327_07615 [Candidatus Woesearchaeota archaeon]|nr:hypothetical protein [Candidatus Woesearchaeota archaeon]
MNDTITAIYQYVQPLIDLIMLNLGENLLNLFIYAVGVSVYAVVVWKLYHHLGKRTLFKTDLNQPKKLRFLHKFWGFIQFLIKSLIIFPFFSMIWFLILGGFILLLSKTQDVEHILLMSVTVIIATRITAYYNEDLSKDLAKLIPLALLGVFIVDPAFFSIDATIGKIYALPGKIHIIIQYMISLVIIEFMLRSIVRIKLNFRQKKSQSIQ